MSKIYAFPSPKSYGSQPIDQGMELRDYFTAVALEGLCASQGTSEGEWTTDEITLAKVAYKQADAMMKQRKEQ